MNLLLIFPIAVLAILIYLYYKGLSNTVYTASENEFKQGGVTVNFSKKTILINQHKYNVDKITGIRTKSFSTGRTGSSKAKNVIIEVDDFKKPIHKIMFVTSGHADKFMQRLTTALRKAGGPNFT